MKKVIVIMLSAFLAMSCTLGCMQQGSAQTEGPEDTTDTALSHPVEDTIPATEERLPAVSDNAIRMYYDDRLDMTAVAGSVLAVEIVSQTPTSKIVCTEQVDNAVVDFVQDDNTLVAVGTGTANISINGTAYEVTVSPAPISLVMITGHSIGAGQTGVEAQSVVCADGQAYSSHGTATAMGTSPDGVGIGYAAPVKPDGIDAFSAAGSGTIGEGSALAWKWNALTGEKIWVLNAAVGGTCLPEWIKGEKVYKEAVALFRYAQTILTNEIAAGHYRLKDMAIIYHSAANYGYKGVTYTDVNGEFWYDSLWNGFKSDLAMDMDGDGKKETVQGLGFVPIWSGSSANKIYENDKAANYFMGASVAYPDMFMASEAAKKWNSDANVLATFPDITYTTHGEPVSNPTQVSAVYTDGIHYSQVAYNAAGLDIAQNLYQYLRTANMPASVTITRADGNTAKDQIDVPVGKSVELVPVVVPLSVNDLTFTVSGNISITYPCIITGEVVGDGTLTISYKGEVIKTVSFFVCD